MGYPDRLMAWVRVGDMGLELRFKKTPNLFEDGCYTLYYIRTVMLPKSLMMVIPYVVYREDSINFLSFLRDDKQSRVLKMGYEIEVREVLDRADGKVKYYGKIPNGDSWILTLKAIPANIR